MGVHSSQLVQQPKQTYAIAQEKEAGTVAEHVRQVHDRWFACEAEATAAIAEHEHGVAGRCGLRPRAWRYHAVRYRVVSDTRPTRHARQGRPAKTDPPPTEASYRLVVEVELWTRPKKRMGGSCSPRR